MFIRNNADNASILKHLNNFTISACYNVFHQPAPIIHKNVQYYYQSTLAKLENCNRYLQKVQQDGGSKLSANLTNILELPLDLNVTIHNHNTRGHNKIHANVVIHEFAKRCLQYNIIKTVINKITTHSLGGFVTFIKVQLLQKYDSQCMLFNCYVCLNEV